jgi:hypothetical protein
MMSSHVHPGQGRYSPVTLVARRTPWAGAARWVGLVGASVPGVVVALAVVLFSAVAVLLLTAARACAAIRPR